MENSTADPTKYFCNNDVNGLKLLDTMLRFKVRKMIFSSTTAVYNEPIRVPILEDHPPQPINPYGESKLIFEKILDWYS